MRDTRRKWAVVFRPALVATGLWFVLSGRASDRFDPYTSEYERLPPEKGFTYRELQLQRMREGQDLYRKRVAMPGADAAIVPWAETSRAGRKSNHAVARAVAEAESPASDLQDWLFAAMLVFVGIQGFRRLAPQIADTFNSNFGASRFSGRNVPDLSTRVRAEEEAFSEFLKAFRVGALARSSAPALTSRSLEEIGSDTTIIVRNPVEEFFARSPASVAKLRKLLLELGRRQGETVRQEVLGNLASEFHGLKGMSGLPELLPIWQMASGLEGLLKQLFAQMSNVTPSTLRTVASAVDLLEELCHPAWLTDAGTPPPVRLLVVDDDLISRRAVAYALKRAFDQSDLAENGEEALRLAAQHSYDAVFLDIQMPGIDGFEVCSRIHATSANSAAPVVFVTAQSDFAARAHSILAGGNDLIGKPFLSFEITVKALTFVLRGRLRKSKRAVLSAQALRRAGEAALPAATPPPSAERGGHSEPAARPEDGASKKAAERFVVQVKPAPEATFETSAWESVHEPRRGWSFRRHVRFETQW